MIALLRSWLAWLLGRGAAPAVHPHSSPTDLAELRAALEAEIERREIGCDRSGRRSGALH